MHSVTLDSSGSPRKRAFSRGMSEDESLRNIIKETESSSRRLTRSDSRAGTLRRRSDSQQSDQDLCMGLPEMLELQANYDEVVQELRGLEVEREALLFQVDVLQDTLEGVEELLAEAQREAGQASLELEREREAKKKLESMVCSLMQEVERLKEERTNNSSGLVNTHGSEATIQEPKINNDAKELQAPPGEEKDTSLLEPHCFEPQSSENRSRPSDETGQGAGAEDEANGLVRLWRMVHKPLGHMPSLAVKKLVSGEGVLQRPVENCVDFGLDCSPDDPDSVSAYEDASAETPEQEKIFPGDTLELPDDSENKEESPTNSCQVNDHENQDPKNPDACVVS